MRRVCTKPNAHHSCFQKLRLFGAFSHCRHYHGAFGAFGDIIEEKAAKISIICGHPSLTFLFVNIFLFRFRKSNPSTECILSSLLYGISVKISFKRGQFEFNTLNFLFCIVLITCSTIPITYSASILITCSLMCSFQVPNGCVESRHNWLFVNELWSGEIPFDAAL